MSVDLSGGATDFPPAYAPPPTSGPPPASGAGGASLGMQQGLQGAVQAVAAGQAKLAVQATRDRISGLGQEFKLYVESNPSSARALGFAGGCALAFISFLGLFNIPEILTDPMEYLKNIYQLGFGFALIILDGSDNWLPSIRESLLKYMYFLNSLVGRGVFYMFVACLIATESAFLDKILGWYLAAITVWNFMLHFKRSREPGTYAEGNMDLQGNMNNFQGIDGYTANAPTSGPVVSTVSTGYVPPPVHNVMHQPQNMNLFP